MRVKRLEIQGFKSFKDKTVIHFDHSITGIVGPNGCGKSNIVDAFFWVMGEQSYKHMRGSSSEDLIFNGSSKYSALGLAEATLVLENIAADTANAPAGASAQDLPTPSRAKEISVTRRLYRSGEGEYFINGSPARLKDIHELFMDTGVGAKGYSVIEQGQIGKIVNAKPEERRLLIEEAAGIAKYKARKKESLRKIEATQANLSRLSDIIQEIEKGLASLDRQAQKAKQYKKYKDELFEKEISWARRKRTLYIKRLDSLHTQKNLLDAEITALRSSLQTAENSIEVEQVALISLTKEAEALQNQIQQLAGDLSQEKSALELSKRRQGDLSSQLHSLESEQSELESAVQKDRTRIEENRIQTQTAELDYEKAAEEAREKQRIASEKREKVDRSKKSFQQKQNELRTSLQKVSEINSRSAGLIGKAESTQAQSDRMLDQKEIQNEKIEQIAEELETAKAKVDSLKGDKEDLLHRRTEFSSQLKHAEQELKEFEKTRNQALGELTQLQSRLQSLEELDASHEGLADGPKAALSVSKTLSPHDDFLIPLTDAITIQSGFETVLEVWLEHRIESLITADPQIALKTLNQLKEQKLGRAQVCLNLPDQFAPPSKGETQAAPSFEKISARLQQLGYQVKGELQQFVTPHSKYAPLISRLLRGVCVVEQAVLETSFFEDSKLVEALQGWAIVSLDGLVIDFSGSIRGGSLQTSGVSSILKRKRTIEDLRSQCAQAEARYAESEEKGLSLKEKLEQDQEQFHHLSEELQTLEIELATAQRDCQQGERAIQEARSTLARMERDIQMLETEAESATHLHEELQIELQELTIAKVELEDSLSALEASLEEEEAQLQVIEGDLQNSRMSEVSLRERAFGLKKELDATQSLLLDRERRLTEIHRTYERATQEHARFSGNDTDLAERIEELTLTLASRREILSEVKDRIEQINTKVNSNHDQVKDFHKKGDLKTSESTQLALDIEKLSGELSFLLLNLEEKYGAGCLNSESSTSSEGENSEAGNEISAEEELLLGEEVERLRDRIRRLGEVNMMAIEEYEDLKKRYDHLLHEKIDLEKSMENLQEAIDHINKTSEERFKKAFQAIADRFERLFPIIFGGGQAKLSLVYPEGSEDILDAGVDILAQPPGKKVANITLLSGGEKALTAVSLIFAIFMVKPSPFCVLDEVDAPLDDANIGKFNALLREMSVKSQFIVITHNKKTMELNDTLYGVTMEEPGVSKMVSIELH